MRDSGNMEVCSFIQIYTRQDSEEENMQERIEMETQTQPGHGVDNIKNECETNNSQEVWGKVKGNKKRNK